MTASLLGAARHDLAAVTVPNGACALALVVHYHPEIYAIRPHPEDRSGTGYLAGSRGGLSLVTATSSCGTPSVFIGVPTTWLPKVAR